MPNYLRPQSVGEVLRNAVEIYGRNFGVIFVTYFLPAFPIGVWQKEALVAKAWGWFWLALICFIVASCIAWGAITIAVSDICLGNKPSVARSYQKIFSGALGRRHDDATGAGRGQLTGVLWIAEKAQLLGACRFKRSKSLDRSVRVAAKLPTERFNDGT